LLGTFLRKEQVWNFLQREGFLRDALEIFGELELLRLLDQFFDQATCYCVEGYENAKLERLPTIPASRRGLSVATTS